MNNKEFFKPSYMAYCQTYMNVTKCHDLSPYPYAHGGTLISETYPKLG